MQEIYDEAGKSTMEELNDKSAPINQLLNKININNNFMPGYTLVRSLGNVFFNVVF